MPQPPESGEPIDHPLNFRERVLALSVVHKLGAATVATYHRTEEGNRYFPYEDMDAVDYDVLVHDFADDPQTALSYVREALVGIQRDRRMGDDEKLDRLERYFDAYTGLTVWLDHQVYQPTRRHGVNEGIPAYIPDGYVDLGSRASVQPENRYREMLVVNKQRLFQHPRYNQALFDIFATDYGNIADKERINFMYDKIGEAVHHQLPYDFDMKTYRGERIDLADLHEGLCIHRALTFQVLAQMAGLNTRMVKGRVRAGDEWIRHAVVLTEDHGIWELNDVTDPVIDKTSGAAGAWHPRVLQVSGPPEPGTSKTYEGQTAYGKKYYEFVSDDNSYWIVRPEGYEAP